MRSDDDTTLGGPGTTPDNAAANANAAQSANSDVDPASTAGPGWANPAATGWLVVWVAGPASRKCRLAVGSSPAHPGADTGRPNRRWDD